MITIYTDGACSGNPGIAGWGVVIIEKNKELWIELDELITTHKITWEWVKGHAGNIHNEKADYLARKYIEAV